MRLLVGFRHQGMIVGNLYKSRLASQFFVSLFLASLTWPYDDLASLFSVGVVYIPWSKEQDS